MLLREIAVGRGAGLGSVCIVRGEIAVGTGGRAARSREKVCMVLREIAVGTGGRVGICARDPAAFRGVGRCPMSRSGAITKAHSDVAQTRAPCCLDLNSRNPMQARMLTESIRQLSHFQGNRRVG